MAFSTILVDDSSRPIYVWLKIVCNYLILRVHYMDANWDKVYLRWDDLITTHMYGLDMLRHRKGDQVSTLRSYTMWN
ncbi:hypothetical protein H5410_040694, partial [Solanum commersonii]